MLSGYMKICSFPVYWMWEKISPVRKISPLRKKPVRKISPVLSPVRKKTSPPVR